MSAGAPANRSRRSEAGFTLVEVLVALGLLAIAFSMIAVGVGSARLAMGAAERRSERSEIPLAQDYFRSALTQTPIFRGSLLQTEDGAIFSGGAAEMTFITTYSPQAQVQGLYRIAVRLIPSASRDGLYDLVVSQSLFPARGGDSPTPAGAATLLPGVARVVFSYFGDREQAQGTAWQASWINREGPPSLVKIDVFFARGDEREWPTLIMPLNSLSQSM